MELLLEGFGELHKDSSVLVSKISFWQQYEE